MLSCLPLELSLTVAMRRTKGEVSEWESISSIFVQLHSGGRSKSIEKKKIVLQLQTLACSVYS